MTQALFYPVSLAFTDLNSLVYGLDIDTPLDVVSFDDENGGDARRELGVPLLAGMDDIEVSQARVALRCGQKLLDIEDYQVRDNSGAGVFLGLARRARLRKVEVTYVEPDPPPEGGVRLVVRAASMSGSSFEAGVPLFSDPPFDQPGGSMLGRHLLSGITVSSQPGNRWIITFDGTSGDAWLIQLATGGSIQDLRAFATGITVNRVVVDAAPRNLTVTLNADGGDVKLWNNPQELLPEAGSQDVSFTPLAQKHLAATLKKSDPNAGALTLTVPLSFHSDSGCAVDITDRTIDAEYLLDPLAQAPAPLKLRGSPVVLALNATAGLLPKSNSLRLTVKHLGRELNAACPEPPSTVPGAGLRITGSRQVATAMNVAPRPGQRAGSVLKLASVRLYVATAQAAEVVLEVRGDLAAAPGAIAGAPNVKQLEAGFAGWLEFELAKPLDVVAGQAPLWLVLRVTTGTVDWYMTPAAGGAVSTTRISADSGATWGTPGDPLTRTGLLLAQLFDAVLTDPAPPTLRLSRETNILQDDLLSSATRNKPFEFSVDTALPPQVHALLAATSGEGQTLTALSLFSRAALDLTATAQLRYDPFAARP